MPLPAGYPPAAASFAGIDFWELFPDGKAYASFPNDLAHVVIGQTVVTRYTTPRQLTILGLCGLDEADDFDSYSGGSDVLVWHHGSDSALPVSIETKRIPQLGVAEVALTVII
jgi:hypothetical protein